MSFISVFDVLGPNMIGPSSSHTAGAAAIALLARKMFHYDLKTVEFTLYGSFAQTYKGHGTDRALLGGIMGFSTDDRRIPDSFAIADQTGLSYRFATDHTDTEVHPNTVDILMSDDSGHTLSVRGESVGGGKVRITRIDQVDVDFTGEYSTLIVIQQDKPGVIAHITRCLSEKNVNIAYMKLYREEKGSTAYSIVESDGILPTDAADQIRQNPYVQDVMLIQPQSQNAADSVPDETDAAAPHSAPANTASPVPDGIGTVNAVAAEKMLERKGRFRNGQELFSRCKNQNCLISDIMLYREREETGRAEKEILDQMRHTWKIMKSSAFEPVETPKKSIGGLIGGEAQLLSRHHAEGKSICGGTLSRAVTYAMAVLENSASMGLIVAAPTAGSSGIVPGVLLALQETYDLTDEQIVQALFNAGAVGYLAMRNATVAGAVGGCQAEVGVAASMAASAAVELMGGTPQQSLYAASTVLMNMLGLVCDPVGGLVECPCQGRNAAGAANALTAAELALSGIPQLIPFDEMLDAMYTAGKRLPSEYRETAKGGCAVTPTGCSLCNLN